MKTPSNVTRLDRALKELYKLDPEMCRVMVVNRGPFENVRQAERFTEAVEERIREAKELIAYEKQNGKRYGTRYDCGGASQA